jgi:hypothetical protein
LATRKDELVIPHGLWFAFSADGSSIAVHANDQGWYRGTAVYSTGDLTNSEAVHDRPPCSLADAYIMALSPDANVLAFARIEDWPTDWEPASSIAQIDLVSGDCYLTFPRILGQVASLAFDRSGSYLAASSDHGETYLWDIRGDRQACSFRGNLAQFGGSEPILAVREDRLIVLWNPATCSFVHRLGGTPEGAFPWQISEAMDFSADGTLFAAATGSVLQVWDTLDVDLVREIDRSPQTFTRVIWSPDGRYVVTENHNWAGDTLLPGSQLLLWAIAQ